MRAVSRFNDDVKLRAFGWNVCKNALMINFNDIGARVSNDAGDPGQSTRAIWNIDGKARQAALARQIPRQHARQQPRVDIAAA